MTDTAAPAGPAGGEEDKKPAKPRNLASARAATARHVRRRQRFARRQTFLSVLGFNQEDEDGLLPDDFNVYTYDEITDVVRPQKMSDVMAEIEFLESDPENQENLGLAMLHRRAHDKNIVRYEKRQEHLAEAETQRNKLDAAKTKLAEFDEASAAKNDAEDERLARGLKAAMAEHEEAHEREQKMFSTRAKTTRHKLKELKSMKGVMRSLQRGMTGHRGKEAKKDFRARMEANMTAIMQTQGMISVPTQVAAPTNPVIAANAARANYLQDRVDAGLDGDVLTATARKVDELRVAGDEAAALAWANSTDRTDAERAALAALDGAARAASIAGQKAANGIQNPQGPTTAADAIEQMVNGLGVQKAKARIERAMGDPEENAERAELARQVAEAERELKDGRTRRNRDYSALHPKKSDRRQEVLGGGPGVISDALSFIGSLVPTVAKLRVAKLSDDEALEARQRALGVDFDDPRIQTDGDRVKAIRRAIPTPTRTGPAI